MDTSERRQKNSLFLPSSNDGGFEMPVGRYRCDVCEEEFRSESDALAHMLDCQCVDCSFLSSEGKCTHPDVAEKEAACAFFDFSEGDE